jgi:hypothetical protein
MSRSQKWRREFYHLGQPSISAYYRIYKSSECRGLSDNKTQVTVGKLNTRHLAQPLRRPLKRKSLEMLLIINQPLAKANPSVIG